MKLSATAPAKVILIGEHAVNRGATALAVGVGLYATVALTVLGAPLITLAGGGHSARTTRDEVLALGERVDSWRAREEYTAIQALAAQDFFAPTKYVLAALGEDLPEALGVRITSAIPASAGLGSGGACFAGLAAALAELTGQGGDTRAVAGWAQRGDIVAHGGVASGLDTQTSLYGGAIRYTAARQGEPTPLGPGLCLVIGNTGVFAATADVNGRVRRWLAEQPARAHHFQEIGLLARYAEAALRDGNWPELGRLMNLNQLILEKIGVSCPELERLIDAALGAGALGAKLSGSGGGGIMVALVTPETARPVARAVEAAGGTAIAAPVGVPGAAVRAEA
ncbi:MAG: hypothetical protein RLZZ387_1037 [Chloroflexota bacterium]|jgi:mevalonate kinase